jgi:hypothetical protein
MRSNTVLLAGVAMYSAYQFYMLTGRTVLDDLLNDRFPDIEPAMLEQLSGRAA